MNSTELPGDTLRLLTLLNSLETELEIPYLERRLKGKSRKSNSMEELQDAIQEITQREKDLQASIGISKVLLENNERLQSKVRTVEQEKQEVAALLKEKKGELLTLKQELQISEEKYQIVNSTLMRSEAKYIKLTSEVKQLRGEAHTRRSSLPEQESISIDRYDSDINELATKFKQEYEYVLSIFYLWVKIEAEKKCKILDEELNNNKIILQQAEDEITELVKKNRALEKNIKKIDEELKNENEERQEIERKFDEIFRTHQDLIAHAEKL